MAAALGTLTAAEATGVLACCTYIAGLSGERERELAAAAAYYAAPT